MAWATTSDGLRISIKRLFEIWQIGNHGYVLNTSLHWTRQGETKSHSNIDIQRFGTEGDGTGQLAIAFHTNGGPLIEQTIRLVTTKPRYGGVRWWFVCPRTGERCLFLYSLTRSGGFYSRKGLGLKYECQKEDNWNRLLRRSQKIETRYGVPNWSDGWFPKPKGMHLRTYNQRLAELDWYQQRLDSRFIGLAAKLDPELFERLGLTLP